jgi:hypothetical protein
MNALYIRRAETFHTEEYIRNALSKYGTVGDVTFIKKVNEKGQEYNGVIVLFEKFFTNELVSKLMYELTNMPDHTSRIFHDGNRFWIVNEHTIVKPMGPTTVLPVWSSGISDAQKVIELEGIVQSIMFQMRFLQSQLEKSESRMMDREYEHTRNAFVNADLREQLEQKELTIQIQMDQIACMAIDIAKKENECIQLREFIDEEHEFTNYHIDEATELRMKMEREEENEHNKNIETMFMISDLRALLWLRDRTIQSQQEQIDRITSDMEKKEDECAQLREIIREERSIMNYIEAQAEEMRDMLNISYTPKMTIEELDLS